MPSNEEAAAEKVPKLVERIVTPQGISARLFLVPYHAFQLALLMSKIPPPLELVLFRRFMVKVANRIAKENGHQAIVTGDNLGQVASQTLENMTVVDNASDLSIFRPLLTYDKQEIVALAQQIGTYELSIQPYKDCCSLIARHPETRANLQDVLEAEKMLPLEQIIERTISETMVLTIGIREPHELSK
jgi:thiamine biosynthesis protein ThiI